MAKMTQNDPNDPNDQNDQNDQNAYMSKSQSISLTYVTSNFWSNIIQMERVLAWQTL